MQLVQHDSNYLQHMMLSVDDFRLHESCLGKYICDFDMKVELQNHINFIFEQECYLMYKQWNVVSEWPWAVGQCIYDSNA